jgi:hypothetical protein
VPVLVLVPTGVLVPLPPAGAGEDECAEVGWLAVDADEEDPA